MKLKVESEEWKVMVSLCDNKIIAKGDTATFNCQLSTVNSS